MFKCSDLNSYSTYTLLYSFMFLICAIWQFLGVKTTNCFTENSESKSSLFLFWTKEIDNPKTNGVLKTTVILTSFYLEMKKTQESYSVIVLDLVGYSFMALKTTVIPVWIFLGTGSTSTSTSNIGILGVPVGNVPAITLGINILVSITTEITI